MLILPSITTTPNAHWREKISEVKKLGLTEVALFATGIGIEERQELYAQLKETKITSIPFLHIRSDMPLDEIKYIFDTYNVKAANVHSSQEFPLVADLAALKSRIYIENTSYDLTEEMGDWAGLCLDVSHLENNRLMDDPLYRKIFTLLAKYPIGAWHLNSIKPQPFIHPKLKQPTQSSHSFEQLSEFDYCVDYRKYLPSIVIALELENSLSDQLRAKEYVEKILR